MGEETKSFEHFLRKQQYLLVNFTLKKREGTLLDTMVIRASMIDKSETQNEEDDPPIYSTSMKVFSHKDGLSSLTKIANVIETRGNYQIQFDYGGLVLEAVLKNKLQIINHFLSLF